MTVAVRVIPCLDVDAGRVVKGVNFLDLRDAGDPVELAAAYDRAGADELTFLGVTAPACDRATTLAVVQRAAPRGAAHGGLGVHSAAARRRAAPGRARGRAAPRGRGQDRREYRRDRPA